MRRRTLSAVVPLMLDEAPHFALSSRLGRAIAAAAGSRVRSEHLLATGLVSRAWANWLMATLSAVVVMHAAPQAFAQSVPGRSITDGITGIGKGKSRGEINAKPTRNYEPLTLGDWLFYPVLTAGYVYNDNLTATQFNKISASGLRVQPTFVARRNTGIHDTTLYASGDFQLYDRSNSDQFSFYGGGTHVWEIQRDLVARFQAEAGRFVSQSAYSGQSQQFKPIYYNQGYLSSAITKSWDRLFATVGGSLTAINYLSDQYTNGANYILLTRVGYQVSPVFYAYVEPSYNWVRNGQSEGNSSGYSIVGGIGSDRISLFTFNVYGGYNAQRYANAALGEFSGPTFGGSVTWEALRTLRLTASASHSLGLAGGQVVGPNFSSIVSRSTASLTANFEVTRQLTASATGTLDHEDYSGTTQKDDIYSANLALNYMFTRYIGVNTSYTFSKVNSNIPGNSYTQNLFTIGGRTEF